MNLKVRDKVLKNCYALRIIISYKSSKICVTKIYILGDILKWTLQRKFPRRFSPFLKYCGFIHSSVKGRRSNSYVCRKVDQREPTNVSIYVSKGLPCIALVLLFDSVIIWKRPDYRQDILVKLVTRVLVFAVLDDAKKLYSGFNLADPKTSVSMTLMVRLTMAAFL